MIFKLVIKLFANSSAPMKNRGLKRNDFLWFTTQILNSSRNQCYSKHNRIFVLLPLILAYVLFVNLGL